MTEERRSGLISSMKFTLPEFEIEILVMLIRRLLKIVGVGSRLRHNLTRLTLSPTVHDMKNTIPELTVPITHQPLKQLDQCMWENCAIPRFPSITREIPTETKYSLIDVHIRVIRLCLSVVDLVCNSVEGILLFFCARFPFLLQSCLK